MNFSVETPPKNIDADFAVNAAMLIAKKIKSNPRNVAAEIIDLILSSLGDFVNKAEIAGAGFINIHLKDKVLFDELKKIVFEKDKYGSKESNHKEKIMRELKMIFKVIHHEFDHSSHSPIHRLLDPTQ